METQIITENNRLRTFSKEFEGTLPEALKIFVTLRKAMEEHKGIGCAGIQVDLPVRIFAAGNPAQLFINPRIVSKSSVTKSDWEGCLSCPNAMVKVRRSHSIELEYETILEDKIEKVKTKFKGFDARVIQHEFDHLNGILIIDKGKVYRP